MSKAIPTQKQLEWADMETGVIIHYLADIYNPDFKGYKTGAVRTELSPDSFNPSRLSPEQWVRSAYELGAKYAVLVANHCTGFSLWRTKVNDYSCASMKWKNGKGDIVREFVDACKKYGIKPGLYYSTGCNGYYDINDEEKQDYRSEKYTEYVKCVQKQVEELWSEYGELFEIWFDGGIVPVEQGGPDIYPILMKHQPDALTFQGPVEHKNNLRWVGNEDGRAPENCWGAYTPGKSSVTGDPDGEYWIPAETDFPNRSKKAFGGGWAWRANEEKYALTPEQLLQCYVNSVGRNSNMLVGMAISTDGDFQDEEQFIEYGKLFKKTFGIAKAELLNPCGDEFTIQTGGMQIDYISSCEDITGGHNVKGFAVYADGKELYRGECIGHKRIIPAEGIKAEKITVKITAKNENAKIKKVALY
ncbi:MAG: alpha-L-fucosidase [Clostridia bacterium]|nr:alpha-L-fucosidase [Clostridia bacterium]